MFILIRNPNRMVCFLLCPTQSSKGNTKLDAFVRPELVRALRNSKGFIFQSMGRVTRLVNSL